MPITTLIDTPTCNATEDIYLNTFRFMTQDEYNERARNGIQQASRPPEPPVGVSQSPPLYYTSHTSISQETPRNILNFMRKLPIIIGSVDISITDKNKLLNKLASVYTDDILATGYSLNSWISLGLDVHVD